MPKLVTRSQFADPDSTYQALVDAHRGRSPEDSAALNARLVLILANHIGDSDLLQDAIVLARRADPDRQS